MKLIKIFLCCIGLIVSLQVSANDNTASDVTEERLKNLSKELRCLVCQNQTLADSSAGLAEDLRREIRELINKGMSDKEIIDYLVVRYSDFVRYNPPLNKNTSILWIGPFILLILGCGILLVTLKSRNKTLADDDSADNTEI